jgi:hypothetical protein
MSSLMRLLLQRVGVGVGVGVGMDPRRRRTRQPSAPRILVPTRWDEAYQVGGYLRPWVLVLLYPHER